MRLFLRNANARLLWGLGLTAFFFFLGFVVYFFPHENPFTYNTYPRQLSPSWEHLLGTTSMGQDIFWLLIEAIHNSLVIGLLVALIGTVVGVLVGLMSGFAGGFVDRILMLITDTFVVIPSLPILILMTALMKGTMTTYAMALVLALFAWAWPSRQVRSQALSLKERDFINTARFSGEGAWQIVITEILPYVLSWSLSNFMNATLAAIASESSLAVLGLSPANLISLGNVINWARQRNAIFTQQWFWIGSPIVTTVIMFVGLFLLITGYNDYTAKQRGRL